MRKNLYKLRKCLKLNSFYTSAAENFKPPLPLKKETEAENIFRKELF